VARLEDTSESHWRHRWIAKTAIVSFVFPIFLLTILHVWKLVLLALASVLPRNAAWIGWTAGVVGIALALWIAFVVCRRIWPSARHTRP
jgi:cytochrome c biogenesis protein CcdA